MVNTLYFGDNLDILRTRIDDESIDLIYLDPPFNSRVQYNLVFGRPGDEASAQAGAFRDTWMWGEEAERSYDDIMKLGGSTARFIDALRSALRESDMMAYLAMMAARLAELHAKLKSSGSLYLHCDPTASHYLKILLDGIFGAQAFRNEIVWKRTTAHSSAKRYAPVHDTILYYQKGGRGGIWNEPRVAYEEEYLDRYYKYDDGDGRLYWRADLTGAGIRTGDSGKPWRGRDPTKINRHWAISLDAVRRVVGAAADKMTAQGKLDALDAAGLIYWPKGGGMPQFKRYREQLKGRAVGDIWDDLNRINPVGNERVGYPTQKPLALLERIILASSNKGSVILDPFCGCGTTIEAAERHHRQWIGIDVAIHAMKVIEARLADRIGASVKYKIRGIPRDFESAVKLAERDKYQFQWWANYLFNPHALREQKRGADRGIDGELFFPNGPGRPWGRMLTSVKGGDNVGPAQVREFAHVLKRENAVLGLFICLHPPTRAMITEATSAGFADTVHGMIPRLQIVAIQEWFKGKVPILPPLEHLPTAALASTRRRALPKAPRPDPTQPELPLSYRGGKSADVVRHFNPTMVRAELDQRQKKMAL